ncbi:MAG: hypothetical protein K2W96_20840 [Gemmataceae bacterium]|nr:hypothetical protein [Gemmataceae bacterium]
MRQQVKKKVAAVLRVSSGSWYAGDILIDRKGRVHHASDVVPRDVVLKALMAFTRGRRAAEVVSSENGESYAWFEVVAESRVESLACAA